MSGDIVKNKEENKSIYPAKKIKDSSYSLFKKKLRN